MNEVTVGLGGAGGLATVTLIGVAATVVVPLTDKSKV